MRNGGGPGVRGPGRRGGPPVFERFWTHDLLSRLGGPQKESAWVLAEKVPGMAGAAPSTFEDAYREMDGTLILHGTVEALQRKGACGSLSSFGGRRSEIRACLDPKTAEVIAVRIAPEG